MTLDGVRSRRSFANVLAPRRGGVRPDGVGFVVPWATADVATLAQPVDPP